MNHKGQEPANKGRKFPAEPLTPEEMELLLNKCSMRAPTGIRNKALITFLYRSGLRVSEILGLRISDVNTARRSIKLLDTKSGTDQTRHYHAKADDALARWLDTRKALGITRGPLFCTLDGGPVSAEYVRGMLNRLAGKAGLEKRVHPHGMRHTFAVELEAAGMPVTTISKLLGHSSVAVTARYLDHMTNFQAGQALGEIDLP